MKLLKATIVSKDGFYVAKLSYGSLDIIDNLNNFSLSFGDKVIGFINEQGFYHITEICS